MDQLKNSENTSWIMIVGVFLIAILYLPLILLGEDSYIMNYDNLDSDVVYLHMMKMSQTLLPWSEAEMVPYIMNGISKDYFHSPFSLIRVFFYCLPSYWAYVLNSFVVRVIGCVGVYLLGRDYFPVTDKKRAWLLLVAVVTFGLLPIYSIYGLSTMGQPLLLWAFLNLRLKKRQLASFGVITLIPFYSHFAMVGPFFCGGLILYGWVMRWWFKQTINPLYWWGILYLLVVYLLVNQTIIFTFIGNSVPSHRSEMVMRPFTIKKIIIGSLTTWVKGYWCAGRYQLLPLILLVAIAIRDRSMYWRRMLTIVGILLGISVFIYSQRTIVYLLTDHFRFLTSFQLARLAFLMPIFVVVLMLSGYQDEKLSKWKIGSMLLLFGALVVYRNEEIAHNWAKLTLSSKFKSHIPAYRAFFSEELMTQIKEDIGSDPSTYRVASLGIHPSVAQHNGFYTLDGYHNNYPLAYKHEFRKVIAKELDKDPELMHRYDEWGNGCLLYSAELWFECGGLCQKMEPERVVENWDIQTDILKKMGGRYIFSAVRVENAEALGLTLRKLYQNESSFYNVYVYEL